MNKNRILLSEGIFDHLHRNGVIVGVKEKRKWRMGALLRKGTMDYDHDSKLIVRLLKYDFASTLSVFDYKIKNLEHHPRFLFSLGSYQILDQEDDVRLFPAHKWETTSVLIEPILGVRKLFNDLLPKESHLPPLLLPVRKVRAVVEGESTICF